MSVSHLALKGRGGRTLEKDGFGRSILLISLKIITVPVLSNSDFVFKGGHRVL